MMWQMLTVFDQEVEVTVRRRRGQAKIRVTSSLPF
jgi:hypothetical protein